jgi:hypothetical protein
VVRLLLRPSKAGSSWALTISPVPLLSRTRVPLNTLSMSSGRQEKSCHSRLMLSRLECAVSLGTAEKSGGSRAASCARKVVSVCWFTELACEVSAECCVKGGIASWRLLSHDHTHDGISVHSLARDSGDEAPASRAYAGVARAWIPRSVARNCVALHDLCHSRRLPRREYVALRATNLGLA